MTRKVTRRKVNVSALEHEKARGSLPGGGSGLVVMSSASSKILSRVVTREKELQSRGASAAPSSGRGIGGLTSPLATSAAHTSSRRGSREGSRDAFGAMMSSQSMGAMPVGNRLLHASASAPTLTHAVNHLQLGWEVRANVCVCMCVCLHISSE